MTRSLVSPIAFIVVFGFGLLSLSACDSSAADRMRALPPMAIPDTETRKGPWQLTTGKHVPITHRDRRVYVSRKSQLVYADSTPLRTVDGREVFLLRGGILIDRQAQRQPRYLLELEAKRPLPDGLGFSLEGY